MSKTIRTQTRGIKATDAISRALQTRTPFVTGGALSGVRGAWTTGYLPADWARTYTARRAHITYTVLSYATPIAWYDDDAGTWVVPDTRYSVTTSKHQGTTRLAIHYTGEGMREE